MGLHEIHHTHKKDAPSGTAKRLAEIIGLPQENISYERIGEVPGTHILTLSGPYDKIILKHEALNRDLFAASAAEIAAWLVGRPAGFYTMQGLCGICFKIFQEKGPYCMKIHFIGIGGVGMSALAQLHAMGGDTVTGSDRLISKGYTDLALWDYLKKLNIALFPQDGSGLDKDTNLVILSSAIEEDNPELQKAKELDIPVMHPLRTAGQTCGRASHDCRIGHQRQKHHHRHGIRDFGLRGQKPLRHYGGGHTVFTKRAGCIRQCL